MNNFSDDILQGLRSQLQERLSIEPGERILLAVSGGLDSVAMARLFWRLGQKCGLAHCNFQLRDSDSDGDAEFVKELAENYGFPFYTTRFATKELARAQKRSIQVLTRELRYEWLEKIRLEQRYDWIATAHHINDSIETILYNWTKGSGLRGLRGIPERNGRIIRPLSFADRSDLERYATLEKLHFRQDVSNLEDKYNRNKIRLKVVPVLKKINPSLEQTIWRYMERMREVETLYEWALNKWRSDCLQENETGFRIAKAPLLHFPAAKTLLFEFLKNYGFSNRQTEQIYQSLGHEPGAVFYSSTHRLLLDREWLIGAELNQKKEAPTYKISAADALLQLPDGKLHIQRGQKRPAEWPDTPLEALLDADQLLYPLSVRHWKAGDRFAPLGMGGRRQKLQDFFSNQKIPLFEKEKTWLLLNADGEIVWIIGRRISDNFKIREKTERFLRLRFQKS